jgi:DNA-binding transcriptional LysR family regulator
MPHLPDFEARVTFAKVADRDSFGDAAQSLGLTKTNSKALSRLEGRMRAILMHRITRSHAPKEILKTIAEG